MLNKADKELKERWARTFDQLPSEARVALQTVLNDLRSDALDRAGRYWLKHKAPMALYWKVVGVYAGHIARSLKIK